MSEYHESESLLSERTKNLARALKSLQEELEAIDWYQQRVDATQSQALKEVLAHNRDEEIEHACMVLEWLRREDPQWDRTLRTYLFTSEPITEIEEDTTVGDRRGSSGGQSLGIGSLKKES